MRANHPLRTSKGRPNPEDSANRNSCILMLVIYVVLSVVYTLVLQTRITEAAVPLAMVMAIFGTLFLASLISVVAWPGEVRWLRSAMRRGWPDDGATCAISGRLVGEPVPAPISGEPALAWSVDVYTWSYSSTQKRRRKVIKVKGMGRVPMVLEGTAGRVHLAGLVELDASAEQRWKAEEVMPAAAGLRARDVAKPFSGSLSGPGAALDDFGTRDDDYEMVRFDPKGAIMSDDDVEERLLQPGQEVCAFGVFDRRTETLKGRRVLGVERIQVLPGGPRRVAARIMRKTLLGLLAMTLLFLLSHGLVGWVIFT
ncbi:MAG: hypothetical protein AAGN66_19415 [Acidobacteriota bacterium]